MVIYTAGGPAKGVWTKYTATKYTSIQVYCYQVYCWRSSQRGVNQTHCLFCQKGWVQAYCWSCLVKPSIVLLVHQWCSPVKRWGSQPLGLPLIDCIDLYHSLMHCNNFIHRTVKKDQDFLKASIRLVDVTGDDPDKRTASP